MQMWTFGRGEGNPFTATTTMLGTQHPQREYLLSNVAVGESGFSRAGAG